MDDDAQGRALPRRWLGAAVATALVVVGAFAVPRLLDDDVTAPVGTTSTRRPTAAAASRSRTGRRLMSSTLNECADLCGGRLLGLP